MSSAVPGIAAAAASFLRALALSVWFRFHLWNRYVNRQEKGISSREGVVSVLLQPRGSMNCLALFMKSQKIILAIGRKTLFQRASGDDCKRVSLLA